MRALAWGVLVVAGGWCLAGCPKMEPEFDSGLFPRDLRQPAVEDTQSAETLCSAAVPVTCGMFNSGRTPRSVVSAYACTPALTADVTGPEVVYSWTATNGGRSDVRLDGVPGATLIVAEASADVQCTTTCLAVGAQSAPAIYDASFMAVAGHRYLAIAEAPSGGTLVGYKVYWNCP